MDQASRAVVKISEPDDGIDWVSAGNELPRGWLEEHPQTVCESIVCSFSLTPQHLPRCCDCTNPFQTPGSTQQLSRLFSSSCSWPTSMDSPNCLGQQHLPHQNRHQQCLLQRRRWWQPAEPSCLTAHCVSCPLAQPGLPLLRRGVGVVVASLQHPET